VRGYATAAGRLRLRSRRRETARCLLLTGSSHAWSCGARLEPRHCSDVGRRAGLASLLVIMPFLDKHLNSSQTLCGL
ncbi:MAG TPA: hypothetical protein PLY00_13255, partial [Verrucomicrobiota bacterium]|nr:hypothetical protein [Verrucomicrobiota bacterium]HOR72234.1 hypothetical protein [Verrucomicrobiota bacterium]